MMLPTSFADKADKPFSRMYFTNPSLGRSHMKEKEAFVDFKDHELVLFVEKEDGTYGTTRTGSYVAAHYLDDYHEKVRNWERECFEKLTSGEFSPVAYYIRLKDMSPADVAMRVGVSKGAIRKHMVPEHFAKVTVETARRYAEVFGVPLADLFQVPIEREDGTTVVHEATNSPFVVLTKCAEGGA